MVKMSALKRGQFRADNGIRRTRFTEGNLECTTFEKIQTNQNKTNNKNKTEHRTKQNKSFK